MNHFKAIFNGYNNLLSPKIKFNALNLTTPSRIKLRRTPMCIGIK